VFLTWVSLIQMFWFLSLCSDLFHLVLSLFAFSALDFAFQLFTHRLCPQIAGLKMCNFKWNRFPIKHLLFDSLLTSIVATTYLNIYNVQVWIESSQKSETKVQSAGASKATENLVLSTVGNVFDLNTFYWQTTIKNSTSDWVVRGVLWQNNIWIMKFP